MMVLGRIVAPFGVRGWVRVHPFADDPDAWAGLPEWWLAIDADFPDSLWKPIRIESSREHGSSLLVKLDSICSRSDAEAISGNYVGVPREAMPKPQPDEYYWEDLIGLQVINQQNQRLGQVSGLLETGANDVLKVQDGDTERLLPFVATVVKSVDLAAGRIQVDWEADW